MFKLSILSIILAVVAVGCGPTATLQPTATPNVITPESNESVQTKASAPENTATTPSESLEAPTPTPNESRPTRNSVPEALDKLDGHHILTLVPALWLEKGVWISNISKAVQSSGAPNPRTLEEYLDMGEEERASFSAAIAKAFPTGFVTIMRESPREWKEEFGLELFSLKSTADFGTTSGFPQKPAVLLGEFSESEITGKLLNSGYQPKTYESKEYYAIGKDFGANLAESPLARNLANRVFVGKEVIVASPETSSVEEFLDVLVGEARPLRNNPLALASLESLGETFAAVILTRTSVFNPDGSIPLTYEKPPDWGNLGPWDILTAGSGEEDGQPFIAFSIAFDDPTAADSNLDEVKARVENYQTLVPQRFPESDALIEGWPNRPLDEACIDISIDALRWTFGSAITMLCQTQFSLLWTQLVDFRDIGFLVP